MKNKWIINKRNNTIAFNDYWYDLEQVHTSAKVLDFIFQVFKKTWADEKCMYGLLECIEEALNPQANLCSMGMNKKFTYKP